MNLVLIHTTIRWTVFLAILSVITVTVAPYLPPIVGGQPPVQMPGGPRTDQGVSDQLNDVFLGLDSHERQHFVVQFRRELTTDELSAISNRLGLTLDGPVPDDAYITSTDADRWTTVRDALLAGIPPAIQIFEFDPLDKLDSTLRDPNDPNVAFVPDYALVGGISAAIYVRFFDDVPFATQRRILLAEDATQPDGSVIKRGPTGVWAIIVPATHVGNLANYDEVRFVEPTMPPIVEDMDQARSEVGAADIDFDGSGAVVAQWEGCQTSTLHQDIANRVAPIGPISFKCRYWQFQPKSGETNYDIGRPIGVDLDENGAVDLVLDPGSTTGETGLQWLPLPVHIDTDSGEYYYRNAHTTSNVKVGDIRFEIDEAAGSVTPHPVLQGEEYVDAEITELIPGGHPTLVAGIVVGNGLLESGPGIYGKYAGLLPAGSIRSYVMRHDTVVSDYVDAIANGARISTNSFGWENDYHIVAQTDPYAEMSQYYDEVTSGRRQSGQASGMPARMLIVASAGNLGWHAKFWGTARVVNSAKNVIAVGNVSSADANSPGVGLGMPAHDSGRGPTRHGRLTPILSAPGSQPDPGSDPVIDLGIKSTIPDDRYGRSSGTSFSTPIVSGAAAILSHEYEAVCNQSPAPQDLRALLIHSARDLTNADNLPNVAVGTKFVGPDYIFGYGLVQVDKAVELIRNAISDEIETGWKVHRVLLNGGIDQFLVTMVWDDPPYYKEYPPRADTGFLQNDLDLEVIDPDGNRHMPWVLDGSAGYEGQPASQTSRAAYEYVLQEWRDHRNTIEQVVVDVPADMINRTWTIRVRGHAIRRGPQAYTLVSEVFETLPATACGNFTNGSTSSVLNPIDLPDTALAWMLFWVAIIILLWLIYETIVWLRRTASDQYPGPIVYLMVLSVLAMLYFIFRLLVAQNTVVLAFLVLVSMAYVLWRVVRSP